MVFLASRSAISRSGLGGGRTDEAGDRTGAEELSSSLRSFSFLSESTISSSSLFLLNPFVAGSGS